MSTSLFCCILSICAFIFSPLAKSQGTQNVTAQTPINSDLTDDPTTITNQTLITTETNTFSTDVNSLLSAFIEPNGTFTDGTKSITEHINTTGTYFEETPQNVTDQSTATADLAQNPSTFTDNPPITKTAVTSEFSSELNSSDQINSTVSSASTQSDNTFTDGIAVVTTEPITNLSECVCDVTPDFCDIGCCCDVIDCGLLNLSSVFNGCQQTLGSGTCVESWMMFKANINPILVTLIGDLFCVQKEEDSEKQPNVQPSPAGFQSSYLYPFLLREPATLNSQKNKFYKVDDVICIYYNSTAIVSALKQPSPGPASSACVNRNPASFLRSSSLSCSRMLTTRSCVEDSSLNARTYYTGFSILRVPEVQVEIRPELLIPVSTVRDWPEPREQNGSCFNVVSKVEYVIEYTGKGEIVKITLNADLINTNPNTQILQSHAVTFQLATSTRPTTTPIPVSSREGMNPGSPVICWVGEESQPLTVLGSTENGGCSSSLGNRPPVLFKQNIMTGCTFRSLVSECGLLRTELMKVLAATRVPELISMTTGDQAERSKVILQDCSTPATQELCETGCMLPISLSVRVLWAQRSLRALPQNHILGAKFIFSCQRLKCPLLSSIPLTTEVVFTETTVYPEAPRGEPKPELKFPFAFFSRGAGELDQE